MSGAVPDRLGAWVLSHRTHILVGYALATVAALAVVRQTPLRVSILQGLMADQSRYQAYVERALLLGGDSDDLLYVATREGDDLFTPSVLNSIRAAAREMESLPEVAWVFSIADAPRLTVAESSTPLAAALKAAIREHLRKGSVPTLDLDAWMLPTYWPENLEQQQSVDWTAVKQEMPDDPIAGRLLSRDGTAHAMLVRLADASAVSNHPRSGVRQRVEEILETHSLGRQGIYSAGTLIVQDWIFDEVVVSFTVILPIVTLVICVLVQRIFRRLSYVLLTLVIACLAIVWALGITAFVFGEITLLVIATPALILVISTADTIHLASAYVAELRQGLSPDEAIRKVFRQVGGACVLTSVTTFIGFLSMMLVPVITLRHMALACAVGVASAMLLALTIVPMALTVLKPPPALDLGRSLLNRWLAAGVETCARCSLTYPRVVIAVHVVIMFIAAIAASRLEHDADIPGRFARRHPLRKSIDFFNDQLFGTSTVELMIQTSPDRLLAPETLAGLAKLEKRLAEFPEVRDVFSIVALFTIVDRLIDLDTPGGLPQDTATAAACVELAEQISPGAVRGLIAPDDGLMRVAVQLTPTRVKRVLEHGERMRAIAKQCLPPGVDLELSGFYPVVGEAVRETFKSQAQGFVLCFLCVMTVTTLGIRSLRLGLLAVLPNLFPLVLLGGALGLSFDVVDSDFLGIAIVSFGLAVDDTIHFLHRYDIETAIAPNRTVALKKTFNYTGGAIIRTTLILGTGLLPFALSGYLSVWLLGTYLVFVLTCAVLGDLLLLPALILLFDANKRR